MPCNNCGSTPKHTHPCIETYVDHHICNECPPPQPCDCPVKDLSTDCVLYNQDPILCDDVEVVAKNRILTDALRDIVNWSCTRFSGSTNFITIKNVGAGQGIFKGTNLIGEKELKSLKSLNNLLTITTNANGNEIDFEVTPTTVNIEGAGATIVTEPAPNNFVVTSTDTIVEVEDGVTTVVQGNGTTTPYSVEIVNLQKTINSFPYTLTSADDKYTIFLDNGVTPLSLINIPDVLVNNFSCVFIQQGTGEIEINSLGSANLLYPPALLNTIKGQYYWAMVEKDTNTNDYYLMGSLKAV